MYYPKTSKLVYLASPYSHPDSDVKLQRYKLTTKLSATIMQIYEDVLIFNPITHTHNIAVLGGFSGGWERWAEFDLRIIDACDELWVHTMVGWQESIGVSAEIEYARKIDIPVRKANMSVGILTVRLLKASQTIPVQIGD